MAGIGERKSKAGTSSVNKARSLAVDTAAEAMPELLEFYLDGNSYGVSVPDVTELMQWKASSPVPQSHACIEGIFAPRGEVYTVLDLARYFSLPPSSTPDKDILIITELGGTKAAFHVHGVEGIFTPAELGRPDDMVAGRRGVVTGIADRGGRLVSVVNLRKIIVDIMNNK
jgi:two-component system chemotaxis response regulator CheV